MKKIKLIFCVIAIILCVGCNKTNNINNSINTKVDADLISEELSSNENISKPKIIVIDAGHQLVGDVLNKEPIGEGSTELKGRVTSGTEGVTTKLPEHKLTLIVSKKLKAKLEEEGYEVVMIRESENVDISDKERAEIANNANADIFLRIHANSDGDWSTNGIMTICPTINNPYTPNIYHESRLLSEVVLENMLQTTGANKDKLWETDTMSGMNWSKIPVTTIEMGYMSNPEEDMRLSKSDYQDKIVQGIVNGVNEYFNK